MHPTLNSCSFLPQRVTGLNDRIKSPRVTFMAASSLETAIKLPPPPPGLGGDGDPYPCKLPHLRKIGPPVDGVDISGQIDSWDLHDLLS